MAATAVRVTYCPPGSARNAFFDTPHDSSFRRHRPVHLPSLDEEGTFERGIDHSDYGRMNTYYHLGGSRNRRLSTPEWALSETATRRVLLAFMEGRVFSKRAREALTGSERERFVVAMARMKQRTDAMMKVVDRLCDEYCAAVDGDRRRILQLEIDVLDKQIQLAGRPDVLIAIVHGYHRQRLTSRELAEKLAMTDAHIRQLLFRLNKVAKGLGYEVERTSPEDLERRRQHRLTVTAEDKQRRELARLQKTEAAKAARLLAVAQKQAAAWSRWQARLQKQAAAQARAAATKAVRKSRVRGQGPTRERWAREGKCVGCGGERNDKTLCIRCRERSRDYTKARYARLKAERVAVPKEVHSARLSAAMKASWAQRKAAAV